MNLCVNNKNPYNPLRIRTLNFGVQKKPSDDTQPVPTTSEDYFQPLLDLIGSKLAEYNGFMCIYI